MLDKTQKKCYILVLADGEWKLSDGRVVSVEKIPYQESEIDIKRVKSVNAWVPIMEGCDNFCTYCLIPYIRGRFKSVPIDSVFKLMNFNKTLTSISLGKKSSAADNEELLEVDMDSKFYT